MWLQQLDKLFHMERDYSGDTSSACEPPWDSLSIFCCHVRSYFILSLVQPQLLLKQNNGQFSTSAFHASSSLRLYLQLERCFLTDKQSNMYHNRYKMKVNVIPICDQCFLQDVHPINRILATELLRGFHLINFCKVCAGLYALYPFDRKYLCCFSNNECRPITV